MPKVSAVPVLTSANQLLNMPPADYMNQLQLDFFKGLLQDLKREANEHILLIRQEMALPSDEADELDRATAEDETRQRMRIAEREYLLMKKIDKAMTRIENHDYGCCEVSGIEIGLERLLARPTTEYSAIEKERLEELERCFTKSRY